MIFKPFFLTYNKGIKINLLSIFRIIYKLCRPCYTVLKL